MDILPNASLSRSGRGMGGLFPDTYMAQGYYDISTVKDRAGWGAITAVQNNAIYEINEDLIVRSGPRVVDGVETMAALIHPEIFG